MERKQPINGSSRQRSNLTRKASDERTAKTQGDALARAPQFLNPSARSSASLGSYTSTQLLALQATHGNHFVQRLASGDLHRQAEGPISIDHGVSLIPQPTAVTCWAASLAMVASWRDGATYSPATVAARASMNTTTGYG